MIILIIIIALLKLIYEKSLTLASISVCTGKAELALALDSSGSINYHDWKILLNFVKNLTKTLNINQNEIRMGIVTYSDEAYPQFGLDKYNNTFQVSEVNTSKEN